MFSAAMEQRSFHQPADRRHTVQYWQFPVLGAERMGEGGRGGGATCYLQQFYELGLAQSCRARYCPGLRPLRRLAPADN